MVKQLLELLFLLLVIVTINGQLYKAYIQQSTPHFKYSFNIRPVSWLSSYFTTPSAQSGPPLENLEDPNGQEIDLNPNRCGIQPAICANSRYRTHDGSCNNLKNPSWGTPNTTYARLLRHNYADKISVPVDMEPTNGLPLPRQISTVLHPDFNIKDPVWTLAAMQYGQIITHDMSMAAGTTQTTKHSRRCCTDDGKFFPSNFKAHASCYSIIIPQNDPVYSRAGIECLNFVRTSTDRERNCPQANGPAEQITAVTHWLDAHIVYGISDQDNYNLREFKDGRLRGQYIYGKLYLPNVEDPASTCDVNENEEDPDRQICYRAGDVRVNQNPQLTVLHIILFREHNRISSILKQLNPHWDDETIYQESRRIVIAEHQYISYYEWWPIFLGRENLLKHHVIFDTDGYVNEYYDHISPQVINEHATAAFRYFHSAIQGMLKLIAESRLPEGKVRLSDWFDRPLLATTKFDELTRGLSTQPEQENDPFLTVEITNFLFKNGTNELGSDLRATDIQRGRDHGLGTYNDARELCGIRRAHTFEDFLDYIPANIVFKLKQLYQHPDQVDLTVGGFLERHVPDALVGPTFQCIMTEQVYRTARSDRFWFELGGQEHSFTPEQLKEIRKTSIARLLCDNSNHIHQMQPEAFRKLSLSNALQPCDTLPYVDLSAWKDHNVPSGEESTRSFFNFNFFK